MIHIKLKFIISFLTILIVAAELTTFVSAQNQRLQRVINEYMTQNPDKIKSKNTGNNPPNISPSWKPQLTSTPNSTSNSTPNSISNSISNSTSTLASPNYNYNQNPNLSLPNNVNINNSNINPAGHSTPSIPNLGIDDTSKSVSKVYIGDPRDPLNLNFDPTWISSPNRVILPCDETNNDIRINDAFFINSLTGWAAGDRGIIWHTNDGGKSWEMQQTPISCIIKSISFINEHLGIAVGGYRFPLTQHSKGLIFVTFNGGKNWNTHSINGTPFLHRVKMFDNQRGIIVGESSEHCPSGLFTTKDGGRTWTPYQSDKTIGWLTADFIDESNGIGIDTQNNVYSTNYTAKINLPKKQIPDIDNIKFNYIKFANFDLSTNTISDNNISSKTINGWLVGSKSTILTTTDKGLNWDVTAGKLPVGNAGINLELNTVEVIGNDIWTAGSPGTFIYHSNDSGKTWKAAATGVNASIRKITFVDNLNGWAVGDLGTILATTNGGMNWTIQKIGARRLAALGIFGKASDKIPFEVFAYLCSNQGYIGGAAFVFRDNMHCDNSKHIENGVDINTAHEAMLRVGVSMTSEITGLQTGSDEIQTTYEQLVKQINKSTTDGKGMEQIRKNLVCTIRQWQPDIIIGTNINITNINVTKNPVQELVLREIMEAVKAAADASIFPEQISQLGLSAWEVKRVHLALLDETTNGNNAGSLVGEINIRTTDPLSRLGISIEEAAYISHGLVEREWRAKPAVLGFTTPVDNTPTTGNLNLFAGIESQVGISKRSAILDYSSKWVEVTRRIKKRQYTDRIIRDMIKNATAKGKSPSEIRLVSHAEELTRKIDRDCAVQTLIELGRRYHAAGDIDAAAEAYNIVVSQYVDHPLAKHALLWTSQHYAAEETCWRDFMKNHQPAAALRTTNYLNSESVSAVSNGTNNFRYNNNSGNNNSSYNNLAHNSYNGIIPAASIADRGQLSPEPPKQELINSPDNKLQETINRLFGFRLDTSLKLAEYSRQNFPEFADDIRSRFSWAAVLRRRGFGHDSARYYQVRGGESYDDIWSMRARAEHKLWNVLNNIDSNDPVTNKTDKTDNNVTKNKTTQNDELMIPVMAAVFTPNIPFLDGEFDNNSARESQTWSKANLYSLTPSKQRYKLEELFNNKRFSPANKQVRQSISESKNFGTKVMFMYDSHHLYIGFRCPKVSGFTYPPIPERPRTRDSNILDQDRIEILIDVDRDYSTFYSWMIDSRGWAVDSYFGDKKWNSACYIARKDDNNAWYIETAISLDSLSSNLPKSKTVWGVGIRRIVPGVGIECWNAENSINLAEGIGFLMFGD